MEDLVKFGLVERQTDGQTDRHAHQMRAQNAAATAQLNRDYMGCVGNSAYNHSNVHTSQSMYGVRRKIDASHRILSTAGGVSK